MALHYWNFSRVLKVTFISRKQHEPGRSFVRQWGHSVLQFHGFLSPCWLLSYTLQLLCFQWSGLRIVKLRRSNTNWPNSIMFKDSSNTIWSTTVIFSPLAALGNVTPPFGGLWQDLTQSSSILDSSTILVDYTKRASFSLNVLIVHQKPSHDLGHLHSSSMHVHCSCVCTSTVGVCRCVHILFVSYMYVCAHKHWPLWCSLFSAFWLTVYHRQ